MSDWKRDFVSGLIILVPLIVTLWVVAWVFSFLAGAPIFAVIDEQLFEELGFPAELAAYIRILITVAVFILLVFAMGYLMRTKVGDLLESRIDSVMNRMPGIRIVYNAVKMATETALKKQTALEAPVKIEPWPAMRMTAFKTGKKTADGREIVFMPTAPNITTGFVIEAPPETLIETDEEVEQALTRLLSAGFGDTEEKIHLVEQLAQGPAEADEEQ